MLKNHKAIVGRTFFQVTYLLIPAALTLIGILFRVLTHRVSPEFFLIVQVFVMMYEISTEYFGYGPIYRKNNLGMEYLKTSVSGMELFKKSILTDSILRIVRSLFYTLVPGLLILKSTPDVLLLFVYALSLANVSVWSVNFTRYITMYGFVMIITAPLIALAVIIDNVTLLLPAFRIPALILLLLLLIAGVLFSQKLANAKIKASYSDLR